jgi:hypothetical protein
MSQGNSAEMPEEIDFTGGIRGKYLGRYQRWTGLTTADGPIKLNALSTGEPSGAGAKIVLVLHHGLHISPQVPRTISPEVSSATAHAD